MGFKKPAEPRYTNRRECLPVHDSHRRVLSEPDLSAPGFSPTLEAFNNRNTANDPQLMHDLVSNLRF